MTSTIAPPTAATFDHVHEAEAHRSQHGGWVFLPDNPAAPAAWFGPRFTPSAIFTHPLTAGQGGRLI